MRGIVIARFCNVISFLHRLGRYIITFPKPTTLWTQPPIATLDDSWRSFYRLKGRHYRDLDHGKGPVLIHESVKQRWDADPDYRPPNLQEYIDDHGWPDNLIHERPD